MTDILQIDIEKVLAEKNPKLAKRLPRFVIQFIKRVIHQDDINQFLRDNSDKQGIKFAEALIRDFGINMVVINQENIPRQGRFLFVANHPLGGIESMGFMKLVHDVFPEQIRFPVNDILLNLKNFDPIFIPINKFGSQTKDGIRLYNEVYASDFQLLYYPAGLVSRKINGKVVDLEWKKTFVQKAVQYQRDIVPIFIDAQNTKRFYRVARWRKRLGIKASLETFLLPSEFYHAQNKTINYIIGKPISYTIFDKRKKPLEWAAQVKDYVYQLKENPNAEFKI